MVKEIPLSKGYIALVDDEDFEELNKYKWFIRECKVHTGQVLLYVYRRKGTRPDMTVFHLHRVILNCPEGFYVDHINGNGLDNRKANLRIVSHGQNMCNTKPRTNKKYSPYKGVCWHKAAGKWIVMIQHKYKQIYLGLFGDEIDAALAYDRKAVELFGEYAHINFPKEALNV